MLVNKNIKRIGKMGLKFLDKIAIWLFGKMMTPQLFKWMRAHKYEVQKRK